MPEIKAQKYKAYCRDVSERGHGVTTLELSTAASIDNYLHTHKSGIIRECERRGLGYPVLAVIDGGKI